jgi:hypothetical protein
MLSPQTFAIVSGTLIVWAGSHFFGVGEIVDVILIGVGIAALGFSVFEGAAALCDFATIAIDAQSSAELDEAGQHFARAVTILGISTVQAVLLRGQGRAVVARGAPQVYPRVQVGPPPPAGGRLLIRRPATLGQGSSAKTSPYGEIWISRNQSITEQRLALYHELVHRFFAPRTGPLPKLRAEIRMGPHTRVRICSGISKRP